MGVLTFPYDTLLPDGDTLKTWELWPCRQCRNPIFEVARVWVERKTPDLSETVTRDELSVHCPECCTTVRKAKRKKTLGWQDQRTGAFMVERPEWER